MEKEKYFKKVLQPLYEEKKKQVVNLNVKHELKIDPEYFVEVCLENKTFEIRKNDRDFKVDDLLILAEYSDGEYTGRGVLVGITYITDYAQQDNYVVLGIKVLIQMERG